MQIQRLNNWSNPMYVKLKEASDNQKREKAEEGKSIKIEKTSNQIIKNLEELKEGFKEEKTKLQETEMDPKEKRAKLEDINKKIAEIEAEIQQIRLMEKEKEALEKQRKIEEKSKRDEGINSRNKTNSNDNIDGVIVEDSLKKLISAKNKLSNVSNFGKTKTTLEVEKGYLKPTGNENSFVDRQYIKLTKGIKGIENRILNEVGKVSKEVSDNYKDKKALKDENEKE
ncbi:small-conductance mechanosensitive channel [Clostridium punense]|uniref:Small-conductance mechanosensitive channel n=1 Tax=Clostridium punense TaxID=1054297 RepID=A0ABS4K659_9CLOT|nr:MULTISPECIES: hypothetical protein [Clostridium]EQB87850.1 hypothetical protein M918_06855 [Clostridium sp. BL8]MBP2022770.1 small-conductance mechanosensitive channel [Clostridium punense]